MDRVRLPQEAPAVEPDREQIWFFTRADTDLARQVVGGHPAMFVFQQREMQACHRWRRARRSRSTL